MTLKYQQVRKYIGHSFQIFGVRQEMLYDGKERGVRMLRFKNGAGMEGEVVVDRGLSLGGLSFKGTNLSFLAHTGVIAPEYYVEDGPNGFYKNFFGGMMMLCGLTHMGAPCEDQGKKLGLHGPMPCTPGEEVSAYIMDEDTDTPTICMRGKLRQSEVYAEHLVCSRTMTVKYGENKITVHDEVVNQGFEAQPFMVLYHFNFGYPFVSKGAKIYLSQKECLPRDSFGEKGFIQRLIMDEPTAGRFEECYFYKLNGDRDGNTLVVVENADQSLAVSLQYNTEQLPYMTEWKSMMAGDYALGINPGVYTPMGRAHAREHGLLREIQPGEKKCFDFVLMVSDCSDEIAEMKKTAMSFS